MYLTRIRHSATLAFFKYNISVLRALGDLSVRNNQIAGFWRVGGGKTNVVTRGKIKIYLKKKKIAPLKKRLTRSYRYFNTGTRNPFSFSLLPYGIIVCCQNTVPPPE